MWVMYVGCNKVIGVDMLREFGEVYIEKLLLFVVLGFLVEYLCVKDVN